MIKQLCLIYLFVGGGLSCCIPEQWEGVQKIIIGQMTGLLEGLFNVSYDITMKKVAMNGYYRKDGNIIKTQIIQDFTEGKEYQVQNGTCKVIKITSKMDSNCIPTNSTKLLSTYVGFYSKRVDVDTYKYKNDMAEIVEVTVTRVNSANEPCAPVGTFVKSDGPPTANNRIVITSTTSVTQNIKNHTVFNIPAVCQHDNIMPQTGESLGLKQFG